MNIYAALSKAPRALADGLMLVSKHSSNEVDFKIPLTPFAKGGVIGSRRFSPFEKGGQGDFVPHRTPQRAATRFRIKTDLVLEISNG
jgi:hypothetical protein